MTGLRQAVGERHREAARVRRGDQLLGARLRAGVLGAGAPVDVEPADRPARDGVDAALAAHQVTVPRHFCLALSRHQLSPSRVAFTVTCALASISLENGQPALALFASRSSVCWSTSVTRARARSFEATILCEPSSTWSSVTVARTPRCSGGEPASFSSLASDIA